VPGTCDLIIKVVFGDEYKSCSSSLYNFLLSPVTSPFGPFIFLSALFLIALMDIALRHVQHHKFLSTLVHGAFCYTAKQHNLANTMR
jgi:hypothetical protein